MTKHISLLKDNGQIRECTRRCDGLFLLAAKPRQVSYSTIKNFV